MRIGRRPVSQLAVDIAPPAIRDTGCGHAAGVINARRKNGERQPADHRRRSRAVGCCSIAQLAVRVEPPAIRRAGSSQSAGVIPAGEDIKNTNRLDDTTGVGVSRIVVVPSPT